MLPTSSSSSCSSLSRGKILIVVVIVVVVFVVVVVVVWSSSSSSLSSAKIFCGSSSYTIPTNRISSISALSGSRRGSRFCHYPLSRVMAIRFAVLFYGSCILD